MSKIIIQADNKGVMKGKPARVIGGLYQWDVDVSTMTKESFWGLLPRYVAILVTGEYNLAGPDPVVYLEHGAHLRATDSARTVMERHGLL